jgi:plasmid stabilization system protein ParE
MKWKLNDAVHDELEHALGFHELARKGLGRELLAEYKETLLRLIEMPGIATRDIESRPHEVYRMRLKRFRSYAIVFTKVSDGYEVVAFEHASRESGYWMGRLERESVDE